jgi:hypothetical protein
MCADRPEDVEFCRVLLEELRAGEEVTVYGYEEGFARTRRILQTLGATPEEIAAVQWRTPTPKRRLT